MSAEILLQALTAAFNQGIPVAIEIDVRLLVAIRADRIDISPTTRPARLDDDEVLAMVWEMATRAVPGSYIYIDKIVSYVDEMRSASTAEHNPKRRLS